MYLIQLVQKKIEIKYLINYYSNLKESLVECYYLEKLGFNLPESIIQIKLQYSKYEQLSNELRSMLEDYHLTKASFDTIEVSLLQSYINHIQIIIKPGTSRISFGEIGNLDYVNELTLYRSSGQPSSSSKVIKAAGKEDQLGDILNLTQRTFNISNIPTWLTIDEIKQAFSQYNIKEIIVPTDNLDRQFGTAFIVFANIQAVTEFLENISGENKYLYSS
ncbi:unnamed protein product [Rotaria sp. Silwood2]|nr:unnamed protein product [Rotaria sp. Silwood2]CAF3909587.1 unnamed protein product [Rotaria sp. Silwood2]